MLTNHDIDNEAPQPLKHSPFRESGVKRLETAASFCSVQFVQRILVNPIYVIFFVDAFVAPLPTATVKGVTRFVDPHPSDFGEFVYVIFPNRCPRFARQHCSLTVLFVEKPTLEHQRKSLQNRRLHKLDFRKLFLCFEFPDHRSGGRPKR